jgi:Leucine-rich repeat (LRR) protein
MVGSIGWLVVVGNLTELTSLHLSGNQLTELPDTLENITNPQILRVDDEVFEALPESLKDAALDRSH